MCRDDLSFQRRRTFRQRKPANCNSLEDVGGWCGVRRAFNGLGVNALNRWLLSKDTDLEARREALDAFRASLQINTDQQKVIGLMLKYNLQR